MSTTEFQGETSASIQHLYTYPVKSFAGVALNETVLDDTGLDLDRAWMVVDESREFVSQRELPRMALVQPQIKHLEVVLRAPGMLALHLDIERVELATRVRVWDDWCAAFDMGDVAAQWVSMAICDGKQRLRLVRFDPDHRRLANQKYTGAIEAPTQFSDGFPLLVCTQASVGELNARLLAAGRGAVDMRRFRPNIVLAGLPAHAEDHIDTLHIGEHTVLKLVKPCIRCNIPDVNPDDASTGSAVATALAEYRSDAKMGGAITWGMNAVVVKGSGELLKVGDAVELNYAF